MQPSVLVKQITPLIIFVIVHAGIQENIKLDVKYSYSTKLDMIYS